MDVARPFPVESPFGDLGDQFEKIKEEAGKANGGDEKAVKDVEMKEGKKDK
jgi:hypothetical protein